GDTPAHELGPLQHAHVLGGGGEGHPEGRGELAEVALAAGELPDDRTPGRVGQGVEDDIEAGGSIYFPVVYYTTWLHDVNHATTVSCPSSSSASKPWMAGFDIRRALADLRGVTESSKVKPPSVDAEFCRRFGGSNVPHDSAARAVVLSDLFALG